MRKKILSYFPFLDFYEKFFLFHLGIKLYIEVTKNYDMVTNKKCFLSHFFLCHVLLIKKPKNIYSHFLPAQNLTPALTTARIHSSRLQIPLFPLNSVPSACGSCGVIRMECENTAF